MSAPVSSNKAPSLVLILGGARSGKSLFVENALRQLDKVIFFATARIAGNDSEMVDRIASRLMDRPKTWKIMEPPTTFEALEITCESFKPNALIIDCATLWLGWELTKAYKQYTKAQLISHMEKEISYFVKMLTKISCPVFVVSNEAGLGVVPDHHSGRLFRDFQGLLNNQLANNSYFVCHLLAGQALLIKDSRFDVHKQSGGYLPIAVVSPDWIYRNLPIY